jgi:hypothetical protein
VSGGSVPRGTFRDDRPVYSMSVPRGTICGEHPIKRTSVPRETICRGLVSVYSASVPRETFGQGEVSVHSMSVPRGTLPLDDRMGNVPRETLRAMRTVSARRQK